MVFIETLHYTANRQNKPPLALENEKSQLNPVGTMLAGHNMSSKEYFVFEVDEELNFQ